MVNPLATRTDQLLDLVSEQRRTSVREALEEALNSPEGGEVAVRAAEVTGWIHVRKGVIVWAHVSSAPATITDLVRRAGATLDPDVAGAVKAECRATGANFMDVLVRWGVIAEEPAREALRDFIAERVDMALELPDASALFMPKTRAYSGPVTFRSGEIPSRRSAGDSLIEEMGPVSGLRAVAATSFMARIVRAAMDTDGVTSAAVLDRVSGECLFRDGTDIDPALMGAQLRGLGALGADAEEVLAGAGGRIFVTRPLREAPALVLFVVLSSESTTLGLARATIARIAAGPAAGG